MKKEIILYYADWCGHCNTFKPVWEQLKKKCVSKGIITKEYESSSSECTKANISGYPTIRFKIYKTYTNKNKHGPHIEKEFTGKRDIDTILENLDDIAAKYDATLSKPTSQIEEEKNVSTNTKLFRFDSDENTPDQSALSENASINKSLSDADADSDAGLKRDDSTSKRDFDTTRNMDQSGGYINMSDIYEAKYLKYKTKYLMLKKKR